MHWLCSLQGLTSCCKGHFDLIKLYILIKDDCHVALDFKFCLASKCHLSKSVRASSPLAAPAEAGWASHSLTGHWMPQNGLASPPSASPTGDSCSRPPWKQIPGAESPRWSHHPLLPYAGWCRPGQMPEKVIKRRVKLGGRLNSCKIIKKIIKRFLFISTTF